jgi:hypothetical protein
MSLGPGEKPKFATVINNGSVAFNSSSSAAAVGVYTNYSTLITPGNFGCIVDRISVISTDSSSRLIHIGVWNGTVLRHALTVSVPANSGTNGTAAVIDVLSLTNASFLPSGANGKKYMRLKTGELLVAGINGATSSSTIVQVTANGLDFEG